MAMLLQCPSATDVAGKQHVLSSELSSHAHCVNVICENAVTSFLRLAVSAQHAQTGAWSSVASSSICMQPLSLPFAGTYT